MKRMLQKAIPKMYGFYFSVLDAISPSWAATTSLKVFCTPRSGRITEHQKEFLATARHQWITYEHGMIKLYHWKGSGPTILLLHGWESNTWRWKYLIEPLQEQGYDILAIDAPAHGDSRGEIITAVIYGEVINTVMSLYEPSLVVAHSMGGMAFCYQQAKYKHTSLQKLVMLGSPDKLTVILKGYQQLTGFSDRAYRNLELHIQEKFGVAVEEFATSRFISAIEAETLLIHSMEDRIVGYEAMENIHKHMPQAQTYTATTGGHSLHTPEVVEQVMKFLSK